MSKTEVKKDDADATTGSGDEAAPLPIPNLALVQHYFHLAQPSLTHLHEGAATALLAGIEADGQSILALASCSDGPKGSYWADLTTDRPCCPSSRDGALPRHAARDRRLAPAARRQGAPAQARAEEHGGARQV